MTEKHWIYLNHTLRESSPLYGGSDKVNIEKPRRIFRGHSSNNSYFKFPSHSGTHVDAPFHFDNEGKKLSDFPANFWINNNNHLIEINAEPGEIITLEKLLNKLNEMPLDTEFLIIKTGFEKFRNADNDKTEPVYIFNNPGISPKIGLWLRENRDIKFIGFDFISISSFKNRDLGRKTHRVFLSKNPDQAKNQKSGKPILIVEDMKLEQLKVAPHQIIVLPLIFEAGDGAPATIIANV
jgi:kynurenine formamidase